VEATSSTLEVAHEDNVCHKIMKMNLPISKYSDFNFNTPSTNHNQLYVTLDIAIVKAKVYNNLMIIIDSQHKFSCVYK
jgi:hypothetical protein